VYRLAYNGDVAGGQLAVLKGASEAPASESILVERATRKNSQPAAAQWVALKMGRRRVARRLRIALDMRPPRALPAAHFERNDAQGI
jgi:hypothetical protein